MKRFTQNGQRGELAGHRFFVGMLCAGGLLALPAPGMTQAINPSAANASAPATSPADEKLRLLMQKLRPNPASNLAAVQGPSEHHLQDRLKLLESGEKALADMRLADALQAFERAALILHAPDTEIALVRSYMQGGEYRRALAFVSHTAGAHLDTAAAAALYAWLLHLGGQSSIAQRLITESQNRKPQDTFTQQVQQQLKSGAPYATPDLLKLPARLAPYTTAQALPERARVVASGLLLRNGNQALVPVAALASDSKPSTVWLRNGLGQLTRATVSQKLPKLGLALVQLQQPMPVSDELRLTSSISFPGSVGYAVEYVVNSTASPAWPVLMTGFLGGLAPDGITRTLGIDMPTTTSGKLPALRGGPVFDGAGALAGIAVQGRQSSDGIAKSADRLVTTMELAPSLRNAMAKPVNGTTISRASVDQIYETSLKHALQVIAVRPLSAE